MLDITQIFKYHPTMRPLFIKNLLIIFTLSFLFFTSTVFSQDCTDYHEFTCIFADWTYFYSRQSKSALFQRGQTSQLKFISYGGEDYYISVCTHRKFSPIRFKVFEDNEKKDLLYDNISEDFINTVSFANNRTRKLIIEIVISESEPNDDPNERKCVGVLIQFKKSEAIEEDINSGGTGF